VLLELTTQKIMVGRLSGNPIAILCQHNIDTASGHEVSHVVHAWPLKAGVALSGIYYLLQDLVPLSGSAFSEGFDLLGEGVT
jgi:hypothetical protein